MKIMVVCVLFLSSVACGQMGPLALPDESRAFDQQQQEK